VRVIAVFALLCAAANAQDLGRVSRVQLSDEQHVTDVVYADMNGDGLPDLVVGTYENWDEPRRALRVYLQRDGDVRFRNEPDHVLESVWTDVVAYAVADVHEDVGAEVVLFTATAAWVWRPHGPERERVRKLCDADFLWQLPGRRLAAWSAGVRDLDGDGLADLALPEPGGYRLVFQRRGADGKADFSRVQVLTVPGGPAVSQATSERGMRRRARQVRTSMTIRFTMNDEQGEEEERRSGPLLVVEDSVPAPQFVDFDGDGDTDLVARTESWIFVWMQDKKGVFSARPRLTLKAPVVADRNRILDVSYSAHVLDLNGDRRTDCVIFSGDQRSEDVRTQVQFFLQGSRGKTAAKPLFGSEELPQQLLVLAGFAGRPEFADVDGNGYPDMLVGAIRPDLIDFVRAASNETIDAEFYVYLNDKGRFSKRPDLTFRTAVKAKGLRRVRSEVLARFMGDVTGDGLHEFLLRDEEERVRIFLTRKTQGGLVIHKKPLWELRVDKDATVRVVGGTKVPELLVLEPRQILHVRFR